MVEFHLVSGELTDLCAVLASSLVFSLADGQFSSRADLLDAPGSSLGRGAQVAGLGEASSLCLWLFLCSCVLCSRVFLEPLRVQGPATMP